MARKEVVHPPTPVPGIKLPAHCGTSVNAIQQMSSAYYSTNYNSNYKQERTLLPLRLQEELFRRIRDNPKVILQKFSEMCSLTSSTFCIPIVFFKLKECKCMKLYKMLLSGTASPDLQAGVPFWRGARELWNL
jgi:hypothetical protein